MSSVVLRKCQESLDTKPKTPSPATGNSASTKCHCCHLGYHIDLDFVKYCDQLKQDIDSTLQGRRRKRRFQQRQSMEVMLGLEQWNQQFQDSEAPSSMTDSFVNEVLSDVYHDFEKTLRRHRISDVLNDSLPPSDVRRSSAREEAQTRANSMRRRIRSESEGLEKSTQSNGPISGQVMTMPRNGNGPMSKMTTTTTSVLCSTESVRPHADAAAPVVEDEVDFKMQKTITRLSPASPPGCVPSPTRNQHDEYVAYTANGRKEYPKEAALQENLRDEIAVSLRKLHDLEEQVKLIPMLQLQLSIVNEEKRALQLQLMKYNEENANLSSPSLFQPHRYSPVQLASLTNTLNRTKYRDCGTNTMGTLKRDVGCNAVPIKAPTPAPTPPPSPAPVPTPVVTKRDVGIGTDVARARTVAIQTIPKVTSTSSVGSMTVTPSQTTVAVQTPAVHLQVFTNENINIIERKVERVEEKPADRNYQPLSLKSLNESSPGVAPLKTMATTVGCQTAPVNIVPKKTVRQQYTDTRDLTPVQRQQFTDTRDLIKLGERGTDTKGLINLQTVASNTPQPAAVTNVASNTDIVNKADSSTNTFEVEQKNDHRAAAANKESALTRASENVTSNQNNSHITIKCTNNNFCDSCKETIRVMAKQFSKLNLVTIQQPTISTVPEEEVVKRSISPPPVQRDDGAAATTPTTPTGNTESRIPRRRPNGSSSIPTTPQSPKPSPKLTRQNTYTVPMPVPGTDDRRPATSPSPSPPEAMSSVAISLAALQNRPRTTTPDECPAEAFLRSGLSNHHHSNNHHKLNESADEEYDQFKECYESTPEPISVTEIVKNQDVLEKVIKNVNLRNEKNSIRKRSEPSREMLAALKVINDSLTLKPQQQHRTESNLKMANLVVQKEWFCVSSTNESDALAVEDYLDCFENFSTELFSYMVNLKDTNGNTAMHYAVSHGNFDIVSVLLNSKVLHVNQMNNAGYTCVMLVSLAKLSVNEHRSVVERLFQMSDINIRARKHSQTALMLAVSHDNMDMVQMLLHAGADINIRDDDGSTALMCAAEHGRIELVKLLLSHSDCDSTIQDVDGSTALKISLEAGYRDIGVLLYAHEHMSRSRRTSPYTTLRRNTASKSAATSASTSPAVQRKK